MHRRVRASHTHINTTMCAGVCVLLFVSRILKSLDFQERMGLVTKTIEVRVCACMYICIYVCFEV